MRVDNKMIEDFEDYLEVSWRLMEVDTPYDIVEDEIPEPIAEAFLFEWLDRDINMNDVYDFMRSNLAKSSYKAMMKTTLRNKGLIELKKSVLGFVRLEPMENSGIFIHLEPMENSGIFMRPEEIIRRIEQISDWYVSIVKDVSALDGLYTFVHELKMDVRSDENPDQLLQKVKEKLNQKQNSETF